MSKSILRVIFMLFPILSYSQGYERIYQMPLNQSGNNLRFDQNGLFAICVNDGYFASANFNLNGDLANWQPQIANNATAGWARSIFATDNSIITASRLTVTTYNNDVVLAKYDSLNNQVWIQQYGDTMDEWPMILAETTDKNIYTLSMIWGANTIRLMKVDSMGNFLWMHDYQNLGSPHGILPTSDDGCILNLSPYSIYPAKDELVKLDSSGSIQWQKSGMLGGNTFPAPMISTSDNGIIVCGGASAPGGLRTWSYISKYTLTGDSVWQYTLIDNDTTKVGYSYVTDVIESSDGGVVFTGNYNPTINTYQAYFAKISHNGDSVTWVRLLNEHISTRDIIEQENGNFFIIGQSVVSANEGDTWLLMTDSLGQYSDNSLSGKIFFDSDSSCAYDSLEIPLKNWLVRADGSLAYHYATSNSLGNYSMQTQIDTYSVNIFPLSPYWLPCIDSQVVVFNPPIQHDTLDIGVKPIVLCPWLEVSIGGYCRVRPGDPTYFSVQYCNYGTVQANNTSISVTFPPEISITGSSLPYTQFGQTLTFNIGDVDLGVCNWFTIQGTLDDSVQLGSTLCASAHITPDSICLSSYTGYNPTTDILCALVVASYDPNEKIGNPFGDGIEHIISANTRLNYVIHFQNTGTDTAFRVVIIDTLPEQLDVTSIRTGAASHTYDYEVYGSGILKLTFDPISLPDSITDENNSKGYVKFSIKQKPNLAIGTTITNRAAIYFDYNIPVLTEPWIYTIGEPLSVTDPILQHIVRVYPNPTYDYINIELSKLDSEATFLLYDIFGRVAHTKKISDKTINQIAITNLNAGCYFYQINTSSENLAVGKIVKL